MDHSLSIEKEAQSFLQQLNQNVIEPTNDAIDPNEYRNRYETLLGALKLSHSRERDQAATCHSLRTERDSVVDEVRLLRRENQEYQNRTTALQNDLDTAKSWLQAANDKEEKAKVVMGQLQEELEALTDQIDKSEISSTERENEIRQLAKDTEQWKEQAEVASQTIDSINIEKQKLKSQLDQLQVLHNESRENVASLKHSVSEKESEVRRGNERREQLERELEETRSKLEVKTKEFIDKEYGASVAQNKSATLEKQLVEARKIITSKEQEVKEQTSKRENVVSMLDEQKAKTTKLSNELRDMEIEQKKSLVDRNQLASEKAKLERNLETERKAVLRHQQLVEDANAATRLSNDEVQSLKKEMDALRKHEGQLNKEIMLLKRENGLHLGKIQVTEEKVKKTGNDLRYNEQVISQMEKEIADAKDAMSKQLSFTARLEGECGTLRHQVTESRASYERIMEDLKFRENQTKDLSSTIEEMEALIQGEQQKHDSIRIERNTALKLLKDEQGEVKRLEHDRKNQQREIANLRSEVATKDSALVKENYDYRQEKAQKELYADEVRPCCILTCEFDVVIWSSTNLSRITDFQIKESYI